MFKIDGNRLIREFDSEKLWIEPWGENALRVRASYTTIEEIDWALLPVNELEAEINIGENVATIINGKIKAEVKKNGQMTLYNQNGEVLLKESEHTYQLKYGGRELIY